MFKRLTIPVLVLLFTVAPAWADWNEGDDHKMHFPQLPNPLGWDVEISSINNQHECADDWMCSQTGPVDDIHFWYSVALGATTQIDYVHATIYDDDRSGQYSKPGNMLWDGTFDSSEFSVVDPAGFGDQGFADPQQSLWTPNDHTTYQQLNIVNIQNPYVQQEGTIYWLGLHVWWDGGAQEPVGWKTSLDHFEDAAVYRDNVTGAWQPLDPVLNSTVPTLEPLDFAFVITPEPATLALLVIGGFLALSRRLR